MSVSTKRLYLFFYGLYLMTCVFLESQIADNMIMQVICKGIKYGAVFFVLIICVNKSRLRIKSKYFVPTMIFCSSVAVNAVICNGGVSLICMLILVIACNECKIMLDDMFNVTIKVLIICHAIVAMLSFLGILSNNARTIEHGMEIGNYFARTYVRHTLGFLGSNQIPLTLILLYIMLVIYKKEKMTILYHGIFYVLNFVFFFYFGSRIAFIVLFLAVPTNLIAQYMMSKKELKQNKKVICYIWTSYLFCFFASWILCLKYSTSSSYMAYINNVLMDRLRMGQFAYYQYGVSLFGSGLEVFRTITGIESATIDNGYIGLLMQCGLIICIFVMYFWCKLTLYAEKDKNYYLLIGLVMFAILNLIDIHFTSYKITPIYCLMFDTSKTYFCNNKRN